MEGPHHPFCKGFYSDLQNDERCKCTIKTMPCDHGLGYDGEDGWDDYLEPRMEDGRIFVECSRCHSLWLCTSTESLMSDKPALEVIRDAFLQGDDQTAVAIIHEWMSFEYELQAKAMQKLRDEQPPGLLGLLRAQTLEKDE